MKLCKSTKCSDGLVFDTVVNKLVPCPLCEELRTKHVVEGVQSQEGATQGLSEKLGLRRVFSRLFVDLKLVLGELTAESLDQDQYNSIEESIGALVGSLSVGKKPKTSVLFYLGVRADVELLAFWLLGSAYKAGLSVHPFITPFRLQGIKQKREDYENLMLSEVVVVAYSPSMREDGYLVEDFVRQRAFEGKSTYVILTDGSQINNVLQRLGSEDSYSPRQYLYIGIPRQNSTDAERVARTNRVIRNSNKVLGLTMSEVELEDVVPQKTKGRAKSTQSKRPVATLSSAEADLYNI